MKFAFAAVAALTMTTVAHAEMGESAHRSSMYEVAAQKSRAPKARKIRANLHSTPAGCSNAGDQTSRPVYATVDGVLVFAGYECVQDNRGGNGG